MAASTDYCGFCGKQYEITQFMIECDICKSWFHGSCVNVKEYQAFDIDKFFCLKCAGANGPISRNKLIKNNHRHDYSDANAIDKATQVGTYTFIQELKKHSFPSGDEILLKIRGQQLTLPFLNSTGFTKPILVPQKEGLDLTVPPETFTVQDVEHFVGSEREIDVIDVTRQADLRMTVKEFIDYFKQPPDQRTKVFNVISLEFSDTRMSALVEPPYIARKLCWAYNFWPQDSPFKRPEVQKYCLIGAQDSYTDFHIDFGGSSVWYHIFKGEKVFYLIEPTPLNLELYQQWLKKPNHHEIFLGHEVDHCYQVVLQEGQTMFIPTGWIHAVYTSKDSLVFGGNFLHSLNMELQLKVYDIESSTRAPERFRFPFFQSLHWYASQMIVVYLKDLNSNSTRWPQLLLRGVRSLLEHFDLWIEDQRSGKNKFDLIPESINVPLLLKDLKKELKHAERTSTNGFGGPVTAAVVKPEKEPSKRIRRKPTRADFVDINEALSNFAAEERQFELKVVKERKPLLPNAQREAPPVKLLLPKKRISLNDDDEDTPLMIDERKSASKSKPARIGNHNNQHRGPIKLRLSVGNRSELQLAETTEVAAHIDIETGDELNSSANGGVEDTFMASNMRGRGSFEELDESGSASPSTREAIVGMLTMSRGFGSPDQVGPQPRFSAVSPNKHRKGRLRFSTSTSDDYSDVISKVHQDDEYIYPSLDASDDESYGSKTKKVAIKDDESWNPRARVGKVIPKTDRPVREGAKRPAVERVLEAAAQRRALEPPPKRAYIRKIKRPSGSESPQPEAGSSIDVPAQVPLPLTTPSTPPIKIEANKLNVGKFKPKKGMATAKQRLGKILKIHKMVH